MRGEWPTKILEERFDAEGVGHSIVFCLYHFAGELSQTIKRFVRQPGTAYHPEGVAPMRRDHGVELFRRKANRFIPGCGNQFAAFLVTDHRRADSLFMVDEGMAEAAFDAKELTVQSVDIAI